MMKVILLFFCVTAAVYGASDKVVCYYGTWAYGRPAGGKFVPENIDPSLCTHINYAFLGIDASDGSLAIMDPGFDVDQDGFKRLSDLKQQNPALKVLFSVGGAAADTSVFSAVAADAAKRENFAATSVALLQQYNFDGVDVDWEYPQGNDLATFIVLLQALRTAFQPHGYLVTVAVNSIPGEVGGYDIPAMSQVLDLINVMTYDFHVGWAGVASQNSPLYGADSESQWQKENRNANASISYWLAGGADPQKVTIGVAFYGHTFTLANAANHDFGDATTTPGEPGPYTANQGSLGYNEICEFHPNGEVVFMEDMRVPYLYDGSLWVAFDNQRSAEEKVKYAKEKNLAGVMIWSIETDDMGGFCGEKNGLLKAINRAI